jgi:iron complex transport system substrate-binding protein
MRRSVTIAVLAALVGGCHKPVPRQDAPRPRIVSFSPAITQMLFDMRLGDHVVGVTSQDALPEGARRPVVGDAFSVNAEAILAVKPDVLMIQMKPERFEAVRRLDPNIRIEHFTIETLEDLAAAMERIGRIAGNEQAGLEAAGDFRAKLEAVRAKVQARPRPRVLFITDFKTLGTAGEGTFIDQMIDAAGGLNVARKYRGWVMMTAESILLAAPEVLICQAEPGGEKKALDYWRSLADLPAARTGAIHVVTDRQWTIPTAALAGFTERLAGMIHPEIAGDAKR